MVQEGKIIGTTRGGKGRRKKESEEEREREGEVQE